MKKQIGASLIKHNSDLYIINHKRELFEVNELGARVFNLCNGENTIDDISKKLLKIFDVEEDVLKKDIKIYIETLKELALIA